MYRLLITRCKVRDSVLLLWQVLLKNAELGLKYMVPYTLNPYRTLKGALKGRPIGEHPDRLPSSS